MKRVEKERYNLVCGRSETENLHFINKLRSIKLMTIIFFYIVFMSWINETHETSRNHYRASHRNESIKTKEENELLKIVS